MDSESRDVTAVIEQLRSQDINVVRVSYSDMIGIDRGRDVLLSELPAALGHGLPFSRCIYHTTPMGDCIPIQGGMEDGLPDIHVKPDLSTLAPLPWEPGAMGCLGDTFLADGTPAPPAADGRRPSRGARRAAEAAGRGRTGTRVLRLRARRFGGYGLHPVRQQPRQCLRRGPQGRPQRPAAADPALPASSRPGGHRGQPRVLRRPVRGEPQPQRAGRRCRPRLPDEVRRTGDRPARRTARHVHGQAV